MHYFQADARLVHESLKAIMNVDNTNEQQQRQQQQQQQQHHSNNQIRQIPGDLYLAVKRLWLDSGCRQAYERRAEFQLADCVKL